MSLKSEAELEKMSLEEIKEYVEKELQLPNIQHSTDQEKLFLNRFKNMVKNNGDMAEYDFGYSKPPENERSPENGAFWDWLINLEKSYMMANQNPSKGFSFTGLYFNAKSMPAPEKIGEDFLQDPPVQAAQPSKDPLQSLMIKAVQQPQPNPPPAAPLQAVAQGMQPPSNAAPQPPVNIMPSQMTKPASPISWDDVKSVPIRPPVLGDDYLPSPVQKRPQQVAPAEQSPVAPTSEDGAMSLSFKSEAELEKMSLKQIQDYIKTLALPHGENSTKEEKQFLVTLKTMVQNNDDLNSYEYIETAKQDRSDENEAFWKFIDNFKYAFTMAQIKARSAAPEEPPKAEAPVQQPPVKPAPAQARGGNISFKTDEELQKMSLEDMQEYLKNLTYDPPKGAPPFTESEKGLLTAIKAQVENKRLLFWNTGPNTPSRDFWDHLRVFTQRYNKVVQQAALAQQPPQQQPNPNQGAGYMVDDRVAKQSPRPVSPQQPADARPEPIVPHNQMQAQAPAPLRPPVPVAKSDTSYEQILDYLEKNKKTLSQDFGIKEVKPNKPKDSTSIELTMENSPVKGYIQKDGTGVQYKVGTSKDVKAMNESIMNICKLALASADANTVFDVSVAPADIRNQVETQMRALILAIPEPERRPKLVGGAQPDAAPAPRQQRPSQ